MGNQMQKSTSDTRNHELVTIFTFEIDNFSKKEDQIRSPTFLTACCKWHVQVRDFDNHMLLSLCFVNPSYITGWKRRASYRFVLLNQSGKELHRGEEITSLFCGQFPAWADRTLPLSKLKEEGFLENDKLIVKVEVKAVEVDRCITGLETYEIKGFEVLSDQVVAVSRLFLKHPDVALDFKPKASGLKTAYMNLLLGLIETLRQPPLSLSETDINKAKSELSELIEAGFKLDWLKKKLDALPLKRKISKADRSRVEEVEERIQKLKLALSNLNVELEIEMDKSAAAAKLLALDDII